MNEKEQIIMTYTTSVSRTKIFWKLAHEIQPSVALFETITHAEGFWLEGPYNTNYINQYEITIILKDPYYTYLKINDGIMNYYYIPYQYNKRLKGGGYEYTFKLDIYTTFIIPMFKNELEIEDKNTTPFIIRSHQNTAADIRLYSNIVDPLIKIDTINNNMGIVLKEMTGRVNPLDTNYIIYQWNVADSNKPCSIGLFKTTELKFQFDTFLYYVFQDNETGGHYIFPMIGQGGRDLVADSIRCWDIDSTPFNAYNTTNMILWKLVNNPKFASSYRGIYEGPPWWVFNRPSFVRNPRISGVNEYPVDRAFLSIHIPIGGLLNFNLFNTTTIDSFLNLKINISGAPTYLDKGQDIVSGYLSGPWVQGNTTVENVTQYNNVYGDNIVPLAFLLKQVSRYNLGSKCITTTRLSPQGGREGPPYQTYAPHNLLFMNNLVAIVAMTDSTTGWFNTTNGYIEYVSQLPSVSSAYSTYLSGVSNQQGVFLDYQAQQLKHDQAMNIHNAITGHVSNVASGVAMGAAMGGPFGGMVGGMLGAGKSILGMGSYIAQGYQLARDYKYKVDNLEATNADASISRPANTMTAYLDSVLDYHLGNYQKISTLNINKPQSFTQRVQLNIPSNIQQLTNTFAKYGIPVHRFMLLKNLIDKPSTEVYNTHSYIQVGELWLRLQIKQWVNSCFTQNINELYIESISDIMASGLLYMFEDPTFFVKGYRGWHTNQEIYISFDIIEENNNYNPQEIPRPPVVNVRWVKLRLVWYYNEGMGGAASEIVQITNWIRFDSATYWSYVNSTVYSNVSIVENKYAPA